VKVCPEDQTPLQADSTVSVAAPVDPMIGHTLDAKYRLEERLGIGGMGTVYRARHLLIDRPVAVKVLNPRFVEDEAARARFRREAKACGRLQHVNAVTVTDFGTSQDGYVYLVMELLEGRTLRDVLAKEGPLDSARAVALMLQISAAVAAAHEAGIIHRDLKQANIFVVQRPDVPAVVKVLDFGIAKLAADSLDDDDPHTLTAVGAMIGTPRYMSPEQCDGAELTPAADVYSLGVILYEMLTGSVPFSGTTPLAIAMKHTGEMPRSPREIVASIPAALEQVVLHTLEKRPQDRPGNAAEFRAELLGIADRLGFEHAAAASGPNIEALRNVGTESPSGRLVIDISRLRENQGRATQSDATEVTVVAPGRATSSPDVASAAKLTDNNASIPVATLDSRPNFPKVSVPLVGFKSKTQVIVIVAIVAAMLLTGIGLAVRSGSAELTAPNAITGPSPEATPVPSPSPSPSPTQAPAASTPKPVRKPPPKKKEEGNSFFSKGKRALKKLNPF
jgi:serine/threonine-protein kinase